MSRFGDAGLQLPDLVISFPALCAGKAALYHVGRASLEFCRINRRVALHELAHAWDDTSGAVDRDAFLELRHLSVWFGGTEMPSGEQGSEHLADIIAWGLMDVETRGAPQIPANSVSELTAAFVMLTRGGPTTRELTGTRSVELIASRPVDGGPHALTQGCCSVGLRASALEGLGSSPRGPTRRAWTQRPHS